MHINSYRYDQYEVESEFKKLRKAQSELVNPIPELMVMKELLFLCSGCTQFVIPIGSMLPLLLLEADKSELPEPTFYVYLEQKCDSSIQPFSPQSMNCVLPEKKKNNLPNTKQEFPFTTIS